MKFRYATIKANFISFKEDAFIKFHWYDIFEFAYQYLFSDFYKDPSNYDWYLND